MLGTGDKAAPLQNLEMLGDSGEGHVEGGRQFVHCGGPLGEAGHDLPPGGICQGGESRIELSRCSGHVGCRCQARRLLFRRRRNALNCSGPSCQHFTNWLFSCQVTCGRGSRCGSRRGPATDRRLNPMSKPQMLGRDEGPTCTRVVQDGVEARGRFPVGAGRAGLAPPAGSPVLDRGRPAYAPMAREPRRSRNWAQARSKCGVRGSSIGAVPDGSFGRGLRKPALSRRSGTRSRARSGCRSGAQRWARSCALSDRRGRRPSSSRSPPRSPRPDGEAQPGS